MANESEESIEVGLRFDPSDGLAFFGIDEVNERLRSGKSVSSIEKGRALMLKGDEMGENVRLKFNGFSVVVCFEG